MTLELAAEPADQRGFDFMWTMGMAQLGYKAGHTANFLSGLMSVLRPGGFAIHMLELSPSATEAAENLPRSEIERLAVTLGRQPARVASYKRYLAESGRSSPLFDLPQIVRDIEADFERLALLHRG